MEMACHARARGRPRAFDPDEALAAALRVFWTRGYDGASLTDLTEAMGITRPSLYACFGNKEALFRQALDLYEREKLAYMQVALDRPTAREVAETLLRGALALQTGGSDPKGCLGVIATASCQAQADSMREEITARMARSHAALLARFHRAHEEGDLPPGTDPTGIALYIKAVLQGLSLQAGNGATAAELESLVETALAFWPAR